jgi:hypothetical protein
MKLQQQQQQQHPVKREISQYIIYSNTSLLRLSTVHDLGLRILPLTMISGKHPSSMRETELFPLSVRSFY